MRADREKNIKLWTWALAAMLLLMLLYGCTTKYVPVNQIRHKTVVEYDTIYEQVMPQEVVVNTTTDTISELRTTYAQSVAKVEGGVLTHSLTQPARRDSVNAKIRVVYVLDSIPYPVEVEVTRDVVPTWCWWSLCISGIAIGGVTMMIIGRIRM